MEDTDQELCCPTRRMFKGKQRFVKIYTFLPPRKQTEQNTVIALHALPYKLLCVCRSKEKGKCPVERNLVKAFKWLTAQQ